MQSASQQDRVQIADITKRVEELGRASGLGPQLRRVTVEPADDGFGGTFLRISLHLANADSLDEDMIDPVVRSIQDAVMEMDDRFPSVRFPLP